MCDFLLGTDLWANILGGLAAAGLIALIVRLWDLRKHRILKELTVTMGRAIQHRNAGENLSPQAEAEWIATAKGIEAEAISKASQLSTTAGSLVQWLDRVEPWNVQSEREKYVSILGKVIERIRELLERNS